MKQKILSLLTLLCVLSAIPASAYTEEAGPEPDSALSGVAVLEDGSLLVSDICHKAVWRKDGDAFTRYAGADTPADLSGEPEGGYRDAARKQAEFLEPWAIVPYRSGWAVSDSAAHAVRYLTGQSVQTLAGNGDPGMTDGSGSKVTFRRPTGLAADGSDNLYVADTGNGAIRKMTSRGSVSTWAEGLSGPTALAWHDGALYVAETGRSRILRIVNGKAEVLAGVSDPAEDSGEYYGGYADGPAETARFDHPQGIAVGEDGTVYIADTLNHAIRMLRDGRVYTLFRNEDSRVSPSLPRGLAIGDGKLFCACMSGSLVTLDLAAGVEFADVPESLWCYKAVEEAVLRGLTNGTTEDTFSPDRYLTRGMFVVMLSRLHQSADGTAVINGEQSFSDVPEGAWYEKAARWAADNGIVNGIQGEFAASQRINRREIVVMLYRYAVYRGFDLTADGSADLSAFRDVSEVGDWALPAVEWAVAADILHGNNGAILPDNSATRGQAVTLLINFMNRYGL